MNATEKKRKAAMIAVAYYIEQEKAKAAASNELNRSGAWAQTGKEIAMSNRYVIQRRGRLLRRA
jgi:hypothetical protein